MSIAFQTHSEVGAGHPENEDCVLTDWLLSQDQIFLGFLADGQGGRPDGAKAAKTACDAAWEAASGLAPRELRREKSWVQILRQADLAVSQACEGFTTLIGFVLMPGMLCGASVGDSKLYLQSGTDPMEEASQYQRKNPPIGSTASQPIAFSVEGAQALRILAVSDGVWKFAGYEAIETQMKSGTGDLMAELREEVVRRNRVLPDDFSAILAQRD